MAYKEYKVTCNGCGRKIKIAIRCDKKEIISNILDILEDLCMSLPPESEHVVREKLEEAFKMLSELNNQSKE